MSSSNTPTSSSSTATTPLPSKNSHTVLIGVVVGVLVFLLISGVVLAMLWIRRQRSRSVDGLASAQGTVLDRNHPAARITPFGSPGGEMPRFTHNPGSDMRIAIRRPDGGWHFADPRAPFTPAGVSEIDVTPSPSSSTNLLPSFPPSATMRDPELKVSRERRKGFDRDWDVNTPYSPPPAYGYEYGGYINHAKS